MSAQKRKILFVITKATWGGAQKYVFELAQHLKHEYEVVVVYGTSGILSEQLHQEKIRLIQIESLGRDINPLLDLHSFFKLISIFKSEQPDIVHLNSSKIGGLGACAARIAGIKKIIFTAHGWAFNEDRGVLSKKIIWAISWLTALCSHTVIVLGEKEYRQARAMPGISASKIRLIRLGIAEPHFLDRLEARCTLAHHLNQKEDFFNSKTIVGTIAELTQNKGLEYGLKAISEIPEATFIIIGAGELKHTLIALAHELHIEERVFFTGFIRDAATVLKAFDIFMLPSTKEGLPFVLLEAGYAALPVVSTTVGAIPELIINHVSGILVEPHISTDLRDALTFLVSHSEARLKFGTTLEHRIREQFSLKHMLEKTTDNYTNSHTS